jgi:excisionase family DNA binding protein
MDFEESIREMVRGVVHDSLHAELRQFAVPAISGPPDEGYVSVTSAAKLTDYDEEVIRRRIADGDLPAYRPKGSREYRIPRRALNVWVEGAEASRDLDAKGLAARILARHAS